MRLKWQEGARSQRASSTTLRVKNFILKSTGTLIKQEIDMIRFVSKKNTCEGSGEDRFERVVI